MQTSSISSIQEEDNGCCNTSSIFRKVPNSKLVVSEPSPNWFGNPPNIMNSSAWTNENWLKSRFHFSFAEYLNPENQNFGVLRVMNDDLVQPSRGFGQHPHANMEICTYVVSGELSHEDNMGTKEILKKGAIQFMTAGRGILHSEHNLGSQPLRFIQIWINPRSRNLWPNYGSDTGSESRRRNRWYHMVGDVLEQDKSHDNKDTSNDGQEEEKEKEVVPIRINQDANIFVAEITESQINLPLQILGGRQAYMLCIEGSIEIKDATNKMITSLSSHDAMEILQGTKDNGGPFYITLAPNQEGANLLMVEMQYVHGSGRTDL